MPCDDTYWIWVRYYNQGSNDSYFIKLDGGPDEVAIFEGDCEGGGGMQGNYGWNDINWRAEDGGPCEYVEDPWPQDWAAGVHEVTLSYRESIAVARIIVTNDPDFVPGPDD